MYYVSYGNASSSIRREAEQKVATTTITVATKAWLEYNAALMTHIEYYTYVNTLQVIFLYSIRLYAFGAIYH